ncbi:unnamed protein product [Cuscuta europaea]|uniref:Sulfiredoxin n=1 Tax=Cuscuta europaea TaxID=41803 RepID=A0A9P1EI90_CUSEU|nr:unnamed protein product [Cuscuta europaea]
MANLLMKVPSNLRVVSASSSKGPSGSMKQLGGPVIVELPLDKIRRPLMLTRANDPQKVQELMDSVREIGLQVPEFYPSTFGSNRDGHGAAGEIANCDHRKRLVWACSDYTLR